jgi:hypothetical protein
MSAADRCRELDEEIARRRSLLKVHKRNLRVQIVFEWEDMAGMIYVDGFALEP